MMDDEHTRRVFEKAYDAIERLDDIESKFAAEHAARDPLAPDALLAWKAGMPEREPETSGLIYKTFATPAPQQSSTMNSTMAAAWTRWASRLIQRHIEAFGDRLIQSMKSERTKLNAEIGELRADIEVLRGIVKSNNNVTPLRGRADVA